MTRLHRASAAAVVLGAVIVSAIAAKELTAPGGRVGEARAAQPQRPAPEFFVATVAVETPAPARSALAADLPPPSPGEPAFVGPPAPTTVATKPTFIADPSLRWFNGREVRPARVVWMTVTAYSPDAWSCGDSADGLTATLHAVTTNSSLLVAADPSVMPYGSMLTIPGYPSSGGEEAPIVPVLDCGGAIKGQRLDVLYPTHAEAVRWGVRVLPVTVWEYVEGPKRDNPRLHR